ncbi:MAG: glycosyltransferase family 2 protein, partial [Candidatus Thorarchaeota archaeon]
IRDAKGEWVFILNNDTKLDKNCIKELYNAVKEKPKIGMVSPKMYFWDKSIDTLGLQLYKRGYTTDIKEFKKENKLLAPCGGGAFYSKKMLDSIKILDGYDYFDSDYFIYAEDFDLGLRAQLAGWKCIHAPSAKLAHLHGATMNKFSSNQVFLGDRNRAWSIIKNYPSKVFWKYFHWFIIMNLFTLVKWVFKGKPLPIIKSKLSIIFGSGKILKKRKYVQKIKKISDKEFMQLMV